MESIYPVRFFFGANTPNGFFGYHKTGLYDPRDGWRAYLIKSGAGTGKATLMKAVRSAMTDAGFEGESIYCSSDPDSLDAVVYRDLKLCIIDATAPHILEPVAYGECEQLVPLGCCLDADILEPQQKTWFDAADACAAAHAKCCRFLKAAADLLTDNRRLQQEALSVSKIDKAAARLIASECGENAAARGQVISRFLSAVTPKGIITFWETATTLCPKLYVIEDEDGAAADMLLPRLLEGALAAGQDAIVCSSPLFPQGAPSHLLIPAIGVGFLTSSSRRKVDFPVFRRLHAARFLEHDALKSKKQQMGFNRRAAKEMLQEAVNASTEAKHHHDKMEDVNLSAMDWTRWQAIADETIEAFLKTAKTRA
ncbi:MAG: hypothetical protein IJU16_01690 [Clostridia bacterium]|nr:hypothetical protein [Clostridia bacterium]